MGCAYALILGGALGNGFDRLTLGYVVDFTLVHYGDWYFPAFNVADASLTVGAACWLWVLLLEFRQQRRAQGA
jgi:signal peptidase II